MGVERFDVFLDNSMQGVYFAGQVVQGRIILILSKEKNMRGVELQFYGGSYVHWTETKSSNRSGRRGRSSNDHQRTVHYTGSEVYFDQTLYVYGSKHTTSYLAAGEHTFPFAYQLPVNLPSSYEHRTGHVRYYVKANLDLPMAFDKSIKNIFTVNSPYDLNLDPRAPRPSRASNSKEIGWLCCPSGDLTIDLELAKTGYVPGEKIKLNCTVTNSTSQEMDGVKVRLVQNVDFHAHGEDGSKTRTDGFKAVRFDKTDKIAEGATDVWKDAEILVPSLPPTGLNFCNIINIQHHLELTVRVPGVSSNLTITCPIIIGSIPLRSDFQYFQPAPGQPMVLPAGQPGMIPPLQPPTDGAGYPTLPESDGAQGPEVPPAYNPNAPPESQPTTPPEGAAGASPTAPALPHQQYPDLPPPSYAAGPEDGTELTRHDDDGDDKTTGNWDYKPKYMTYHTLIRGND